MLELMHSVGWNKINVYRRHRGVAARRYYSTPPMYVDPQADVHMRAGSADRVRLAVFTSEARKRRHYSRPGQVSFHERSYKLATLAMEIFGRLGKEGSTLIDHVATSIVGGMGGSSLAQKGVCKERLFPDDFCHHPGHYFAPSAQVKTRSEEQPGR